MVADRRWDRRHEINTFAVYFVEFLNSQTTSYKLFILPFVDVNSTMRKDIDTDMK